MGKEKSWRSRSCCCERYKSSLLNGGIFIRIDKDPVIEDKEIAEFWDGLPANLSKLENVIWAENPANVDDYAWTKGSDGISVSGTRFC